MPVWTRFVSLWRFIIGERLGNCNSFLHREKKNTFPCPSFRTPLLYSFPGSYSSQTLAGKMCLLRSYQRRSTTFVSVGSSFVPSSPDSSSSFSSRSFFFPG